MDRPDIDVVVVTYNRVSVLVDTLRAVLTQTFTPRRVVVVDNRSDDDTLKVLSAGFPDVEVVQMPDNEGFGAGLAAGMRHAMATGADFCWLLDDDSRPAPAALARLVATAQQHPEAGIIGYSGCRLWWGVPRSTPVSDNDAIDRTDDVSVHRRDSVLVDGALVPRRTVDTVGYPREDLFMMMEDVEYASRVRRSGAAVLMLAPDLISRGHLGSTGRPSPLPWREYYQTRNHMLVARAHRSAREVAGWALRQARFMLHDVRDQTGRRRVGYRLRGAVHGVRGVTGRSLDPSTGRYDLTSR